MGAPRRMAMWSDPAYTPWLAVALGGALLILAGAACLAVQLVVSIRRRAQLASPSAHSPPGAGGARGQQ